MSQSWSVSRTWESPKSPHFHGFSVEKEEQKKAGPAPPAPQAPTAPQAPQAVSSLELVKWYQDLVKAMMNEIHLLKSRNAHLSDQILRGRHHDDLDYQEWLATRKRKDAPVLPAEFPTGIGHAALAERLDATFKKRRKPTDTEPKVKTPRFVVEDETPTSTDDEVLNSLKEFAKAQGFV